MPSKRRLTTAEVESIQDIIRLVPSKAEICDYIQRRFKKTVKISDVQNLKDRFKKLNKSRDNPEKLTSCEENKKLKVLYDNFNTYEVKIMTPHHKAIRHCTLKSTADSSYILTVNGKNNTVGKSGSCNCRFYRQIRLPCVHVCYAYLEDLVKIDDLLEKVREIKTSADGHDACVFNSTANSSKQQSVTHPESQPADLPCTSNSISSSESGSASFPKSHCAVSLSSDVSISRKSPKDLDVTSQLESHPASHLGISPASIEPQLESSTAMSESEKWQAANELSQRANMMLSTCSTAKFNSRMDQFLQLLSCWEQDEDALVLNGAALPKDCDKSKLAEVVMCISLE